LPLRNKVGEIENKSYKKSTVILLVTHWLLLLSNHIAVHSLQSSERT